MNEIFKNIDYWVIFGFFAQFLFFLRFVVQWIFSEKAKKSVIPMSFWYLSISGAFLILIYAIHIQDPVFITGQGFAILIYIRNIILIKNNENKQS